MRNSIPFKQNLCKDSRMLFVNYSSLVLNPELIIQRIMNSTKVVNLWKGFKSNSRKDSLNKKIKHKIEKLTVEKSNKLFDDLNHLTL